MGGSQSASRRPYQGTRDRGTRRARGGHPRTAARVHVKPSGFPVDAEVTVDKKGQFQKKTAFYIRLNNGTVGLDEAEKQKYTATRWPS